MKKINSAILLVMLGLNSILIYSQESKNPHNVSSDDWGADGKDCIVCHPLQNSSTEIKYNPLWNNNKSNKNYSIYSSPTLNANISQPDGSSKLCLSCHDGTIASNNIGTDLSDDHPVSFTYNSSLSIIDGGLKDPSYSMSGLGGTVEKDLLTSGKLQCTSCHNPHQSVYPQNLIMDNEKSELCFKCHNK